MYNMKKIFMCISMVVMLMMGLGAATAQTSKIGPVDNYGFLNAPDGTTWTYTASFEKKYGMYTCVKVQVYDSQNQLVGSLVDSLNIDNENVTGINHAEIDGLVTQRFFDSDANTYEVMLFLHATTKDYQGLEFNHVFSLAAGETATTPIKTVEGVRVAAQNMSDYGENYIMVFQRDSAKNNADEHMLCFDVRRGAFFGDGVAHTFRVPYANVAALNDLQPLCMLKNGKFINFVVQQYEKPYFVPGSPFEEPVVTENNHLVITHINQSYKELAVTKIPIVQDENEKLLYTFPKLGGLNGAKDIVLNDDGSVAAYVITHEKYNLENDASLNSYYLYDVAGNQQKVIAENTVGSVMMSPVVGQEDQWMFIKEEYDGEFFFVNLPSGDAQAEISVYLEDGRRLSSSIDRYAKGDSYEYAIALLQGNSEKDGTTSHDIAWFDADGTFNRYENVNMGKNIEYAKVNITAEVLNPWLLNTDDTREYMVLVQRSNPKNPSGKKETVLMICNTKGEVLLEYGDDEVMGEIKMVYMFDKAATPMLLCIYANGDAMTLQYTPLPLNASALQGTGVAADPYKLTCPNDFKLIDNAPDAYYVVANDIDFLSVPFVGAKKAFTGKLDGQNHKLSNLCLVGGGLFGEMKDSVIVSNLVLENPTLILTDKHRNSGAGILANIMQGGITNNGVNLTATLSNVHVAKPVINGGGYAEVVGTLVGKAALFLDVNTCSVTDAKIVAPAAQVGGLVGSSHTSTNIHASLFTGTAEGHVLGGIVGTISSDAPVSDCHVDADLYTHQTVGGIVGESGRALINNCYAEGTLTLADIATVGKVGGIVGEVATDATGSSTAILVENCLVGVSAIHVPDGKDVIAHRVIGFSSGDDYEYDWDHVDYDQPQSEWPRWYFPAEKGFKNNYVVSDLAALDATIQLTDTTTEGANLAWENVTTTWLGEHGYQLGENVDAPWQISENLVLWYESELTTDVENIWGEGSEVVDGKPTAKKLIMDGQMFILRHDGLYNLTGARVK